MSETHNNMTDLCRIFETDLVDIYQMADLLDERASAIRHWLVIDQGRLPEPLRFRDSLIRWPRQQVSAWYLAGCPRCFPHGPEEFCPRAIWQTSDNYTCGSVDRD